MTEKVMGRIKVAEGGAAGYFTGELSIMELRDFLVKESNNKATHIRIIEVYKGEGFGYDMCIEAVKLPTEEEILIERKNKVESELEDINNKLNKIKG